MRRGQPEAGFDRWIEARCGPFYEQEETRGKRLRVGIAIMVSC